MNSVDPNFSSSALLLPFKSSCCLPSHSPKELQIHIHTRNQISHSQSLCLFQPTQTDNLILHSINHFHKSFISHLTSLFVAFCRFLLSLFKFAFTDSLQRVVLVSCFFSDSRIPAKSSSRRASNKTTNATIHFLGRSE
jgi:hypothetical protein